MIFFTTAVGAVCNRTLFLESTKSRGPELISVCLKPTAVADFLQHAPFNLDSSACIEGVAKRRNRIVFR
jgi:hypothetical protein